MSNETTPPPVPVREGFLRKFLSKFSVARDKGLRLVAFLVIPSTIGLAMLAEPIISVIYEHGRFTAEHRIQTALALRAYGYGLLFYAALKVLQPAFYAIDKRWFPMLVSLLALGMNLFFNYLFVYVFHWGHDALALTTSITASVNFLLLFLAMRKFAGDLGTSELVILLAKLAAAGALMAAICQLANHYLFQDLAGTKVILKVTYLGFTITLASMVYFLSAKLLKVAEADDALAMLTRKLRK